MKVIHQFPQQKQSSSSSSSSPSKSETLYNIRHFKKSFTDYNDIDNVRRDELLGLVDVKLYNGDDHLSSKQEVQYHEVAVGMKPGRLGVKLDGFDTINEVFIDSQFHGKGVKVEAGMTILQVNGESFSRELLRNAVDGGKDYTLVLGKPQKQYITSMEVLFKIFGLGFRIFSKCQGSLS